MAGPPSVDRQAAVILVVVEIVSVFLLLFGNRLPTQALTGVTVALMAPANALLRWAESVDTARVEVTRLRSEVAALRIEQGRLVDAGLENRRLRSLLGFAERGGPMLKPVQVVGVAGEPWPIVFHLGAGTMAGVAVGQAVLAPEGLIGRVTRADATTSSVALLTDPNAPVAAEVVGTGVRGVVKFRFNPVPGLYLTAVPLTDTVRVGQRIVTSATSIVLPPGIPIGRVTRVGREATGLLSEIRVEPLAPLTRAREVLVATGTVNSAWWSRPVVPRADTTSRAVPGGPAGSSVPARSDSTRH